MTKKEKGPTKTLAARAKGRLNVAAKSSGATSRPSFPVVEIGASAGGLEACTALLKALPFNPGMAFVVVQPLDPHHESILHKLLSKTTEMPLLQVEDGTVLGPDHVYVIPPNKDIAVRERTLRRLSRRRTAGRHLPINRFFVSLAEGQKSAAMGGHPIENGIRRHRGIAGHHVRRRRCLCAGPQVGRVFWHAGECDSGGVRRFYSPARGNCQGAYPAGAVTLRQKNRRRAGGGAAAGGCDRTSKNHPHSADSRFPCSSTSGSHREAMVVWRNWFRKDGVRL